jgi:hypothetical protein
MMAFTTIVIYAVDALDSNSSGATNSETEQHFSSRMDAALSSELVILAKYWSAFLNTWPKDFSNLPMFWNKAEMDAIRGTSYHACASRLCQNVNELWLFAILPCLDEAGLCIIPPLINKQHAMTHGGADDVVLPVFFQRAVGATYSRSHGACKPVESLMKMFECILKEVEPKLPDIIQQNHWLCPLLDCFNGARDGDEDETINVDIFSKNHDGPMEVKSLRSIKSGEELIISYGNMPNKDYL